MKDTSSTHPRRYCDGICEQRHHEDLAILSVEASHKALRDQEDADEMAACRQCLEPLMVHRSPNGVNPSAFQMECERALERIGVRFRSHGE